MSKYLSILLLTSLFLVGCTSNGTDTEDTNGNDSSYTENGETVEPETPKNHIGITSQQAGPEVTVNSVTLEEPGFVVVHEKTATGEAGAVLGQSSLLQAQTVTNVKVTLSRESAGGETLIVMAHTDDGDGTFDAAKDGALEVDGAVVMEEVTVEAAE